MFATTKCRVTATDIRRCQPGDCYRCAVATSLQREYGDNECNVFEDDYLLRIHVGGRYIVAPFEVQQFVRVLDDAGRKDDGRPILPRRLPDGLKPFTFELPPLDDPAWEERCYGCEMYFAGDELDDEGCCSECTGDE